ncbi:MAG TPA: NAD(P)/FAD-dependent oxidoreductase [Eubacteriaceae bacterium]|nr:NAD(P)/FAD-dependent oxidoreductase [Eubacteriaceae bacterium]
MNIVIVGNGIAGLSAAEEIRKKDTSSTIHMITDESYYTYYRTRLSHYLAQDFETEDVYVHPKTWYEENNINVIFEQKVEQIDPDKKIVTLSDSEALYYNKLILANGSSSFMPPVEGKEKEGVFSLRSLDDVFAIQKYAKNVNKAIVVGGGLLGLETANALNKRGLKVTVVEFAPRLLPRQMDEEGSEVVANIVRSQGVDLYVGAQVEKILGEDVASGCQLKDGRQIEAPLILFSAGVRSNVSLAKQMDLSVDRAVIVDEYMRTSAEDVYAVGDVAEFKGMSFNIWPIAIEQGKIAGRHIVGDEQAYEAITPSNMLNILDIKAFSIGDIGSEDKAYQTLVDKEEQKLRKFFFSNNKLVGAILINDIKLATKLKNKIDKDYTDVLRSTLSDHEKIEKL